MSNLLSFCLSHGLSCIYTLTSSSFSVVSSIPFLTSSSSVSPLAAAGAGGTGSFFPAAAFAKLNEGLTFAVAADNLGDAGVGEVGLATDDEGAGGGVVLDAGVSRSRRDAVREDVLDMLCATFSLAVSRSFSRRSLTRASRAETSTGLDKWV